MKIIVKIYEEDLAKTSRAELIDFFEDVETDALVSVSLSLIGESNDPIEQCHEMVFEQESEEETEEES